MTNAQRKRLFALVAETNIEVVICELSAICSWQEIHGERTIDSDLRHAWRKTELALDAVAQKMSLRLRQSPLCEDYK